MTRSGLPEWTKTASMPTARFGLATRVVGRLLYAVGGADSNSPSPLSTNEAPTQGKSRPQGVDEPIQPHHTGAPSPGYFLARSIPFNGF
jgi:hypothetical protein